MTIAGRYKGCSKTMLQPPFYIRLRLPKRFASLSFLWLSFWALPKPTKDDDRLWNLLFSSCATAPIRLGQSAHWRASTSRINTLAIAGSNCVPAFFMISSAASSTLTAL